MHVNHGGCLALGTAAATDRAFPGVAIALDPSSIRRPARLVDRQIDLAHMPAMSGALRSHVTDCIAVHDSMAGVSGPNSSMVRMMAGEIVR